VPRPRRAPQVTQPNEAGWTPGTRPRGPVVVASPQAPTAPLDAPHLLPKAETDAPKTRRTGRRSTMPQMPGTPFKPAAPVVPDVPLRRDEPVTAPAAPVVPNVPLRREDPVTAPATPVVSPPPPVVPSPAPARGVVPPPPARSSPSVPPAPVPPPPPYAGADSDAPRVPAPRHAVATPQAGGTPVDDPDTHRTYTGLPIPPLVPPPPPITRPKGDPDPDDPGAPPES
jgi:hypothetical protein